jgi:hypothetical protein
MASLIGALRVSLGLDTAQFSSGLNNAKGSLASFGRVAAVGFAAVAAAGVAAMTGLGYAVKGAIDDFDEMAKTAQKVGLTVEELTRLRYAAGLSGVEISGLATGLQRLSKNMADVAAGAKGPAAQAFAALGISVVDADGKLRSSQDVLYDLAERFKSMPDGANKTAMAIAILGKSGAEMIPLLNGGAQALRDMADESDRFGQTVSTRAAKAAEVFNDNVSRLQSMLGGVVNRIAEAVLPTLADLSTRFVQAAADSGVLEAASGAIIWVLNQVAKAAVWVSGQVQAMGEMFFWTARAMQQLQQGNFAGAADAIGSGFAEADAILQDMTKRIYEIDNGLNEIEAPDFAPTTTALQDIQVASAAASSALKKLADEGRAVFEATRTPAEKYAAEIERLNMLLQKGAIDQDTYSRAVLQAQDSFQKAEMAGNQLASTLASGLANVFSSVVDGSKSAVEAVGDLLKSLGQMLINQGFQALIGGIFGGGGGGLGNIFGGLFGGGGGLKLGFNGIPGFDGGGFTGSGSRTGGLDGKGGFLSMLHPDETVIDHTKGQGGLPPININITGSRQDAAEIAREVRKVLPDAIQSYDRNPYRRT